MIWWIDTESLMKKYTKRSDEEVRNTNFLILSAKVNCTMPSENVLNVYNTFLCANTFKGVDLLAEPGSDGAVDGFSKFLLNSPTVIDFICTVLQNDLEGIEDTVFVTTKKESVAFGIETFIRAIDKLFGYRIERYPQISSCDRADVLRRLIYYGEESESIQFSRMPNEKKLEVLGEMQKKELRKMARKHPQYIEGMNREEMTEVIMEHTEDRRRRDDWNRILVKYE